MKYQKLFLSIVVILSHFTDILSQNTQIVSFIGHSYFVAKNAGGYDLGIGVNYSLTKTSMIGISASHSYNDISPLPSDLKDAKIVLKEVTNRLPLGLGIPDWENDALWPQIRLEEQPNRYFRYNLGLHYNYALYRKSGFFMIGAGAIFSYRDESELVKLVPTIKIVDVLFGSTTYDHSIPIFNYNTFLDMGVKADFSYFLKKFKSLDLGLKSSFVLYPKSGDLMINNGMVVKLNL